MSLTLFPGTPGRADLYCVEIKRGAGLWQSAYFGYLRSLAEAVLTIRKRLPSEEPGTHMRVVRQDGHIEYSTETDDENNATLGIPLS